MRLFHIAAKEALDAVEIVESPTIGEENGEVEAVKDDKKISDDCRDCMSSVTMAVWNCGTFEMDCIKDAIDLGTECYPCVCEILDYWWPDDAPNCFKKEIQKITKVGMDQEGNAGAVQDDETGPDNGKSEL